MKTFKELNKWIEQLEEEVEIEEGTFDWEKDFKGYSGKELKAIQGIIARNRKGIEGVIKMMKDDPKEFKSIVQKLTKEEVEEGYQEIMNLADLIKSETDQLVKAAKKGDMKTVLAIYRTIGKIIK